MDFANEQREHRVTEKVGLLKGAETSGYSDKAILAGEICKTYMKVDGSKKKRSFKLN